MRLLTKMACIIITILKVKWLSSFAMLEFDWLEDYKKRLYATLDSDYGITKTFTY